MSYHFVLISALFFGLPGCILLAVTGYKVLNRFSHQLIRKHRSLTPHQQKLLLKKNQTFILIWTFLVAIFSMFFLKRPIFGLMGLLFIPLWIKFFVVTQNYKVRQLEKDSLLPFLHALHGMLSSGLSFAESLFSLAESLKNPLLLHLKRSLCEFEKGNSVSLCLTHFKDRANLGTSGIWLNLLQTSYQKGLPILILLEKMIPILQSEYEATAKEAELKKIAVSQMIFASLMPWALLYALYLFQPHLFQALCLAAILALLLIVFGLQTVGCLTIWRICKFC